MQKDDRSRETGGSAVARFAGSVLYKQKTWGLRPRLYAYACFAG